MPTRAEMLNCTINCLHVFNRGVDQSQIFLTPPDYDCLALLMAEHRSQSRVTVLAFAILPNHFHLVVHQEEPFALSQFMKRVSQEYAQWFNHKRSRSGHLFQGKYRMRMVENGAGLLRVSHYVHMNPVRAGLVKAPEEWLYSSARSYAEAQSSCLADTGPILSLVGGRENYRRFLISYNPSDPETAWNFVCSGRIGQKGRI